MLCQKCHKKTASVFISSIINGQETRMYLCSDCAKDYPLFNFNFQEPFSIKDVMDKFNIDENNQSDEQYDKLLATDEESTDKDIICSNSKCYEAFEKQLKPILKNIYGYDEYIGKIPKKVEGDVYISKEIRILKEDLIRAVEKEEYEKAADIRDKIKHLQKCNE